MAFEGLAEKLNQAFKKLRSKGKLSENDVKEAMREVRLALLEADVNYKVAKDFVKNVTEKAVGEEVLSSLTPAQQVIKIVRDELTELMGSTDSRINFSSKLPTIIMMCGLQGSGKTTHSAKLARMFRKQGKRPLLVACDVYRPAAIEQLKVVGAQVDTPVFEMGTISPVEIAKNAIKHAKDYGNDIVILDTAGRLHIDEQSFNDTLGIDGVILTKLDGDTRGGAALSVRAVTGKPIKFAGIGEKLEDLEVFHPDRMASRILGMGDVLTLIEKAQDEVDEKKAMEVAQKLKENSFDMSDLLEQIKQVRNMGPLGKILEMFPGMSGKITDETAQAGEQEIKYLEAIINSMTKEERANPDIINPARKRRIAAGSGTDVPRVNRVLKQYKQMKEMMKMLGGKGKGSKRRRRMPFNPAMLKNMPPM